MGECFLKMMIIGGFMKKYVYNFRNNTVRKSYFGRICIVEVRGKMNSCRIKFIDNGEKTICSFNALKEVIENKNQFELF